MSAKIAYSYLRLSSKRQVAGDGFRRQMDLVDDYCKKHNLILDEEICHIGSAFSGDNFKPGTALYEFLERVKSGKIKQGSYLLVESLDRLSRDHVLDALTTFLAILKSGIFLVTIMDDREYDYAKVNKNWTELVISIAVMSRAREESQRKADRLKDAWVTKRRGSKVLTERGPSWLRFIRPQPDVPGYWEPIPEKVAVIQKIFEYLAAGVGCDKIARILNQDGAPTMSRAVSWHSGTVYKFVGNRLVLGHYQPHRQEKVVGPNGAVKKSRVPVGSERIGYYGAPIVSESLWLKALTNANAKRMATPSNSGGRKGTIKSNLFTEVAVCGHCSSRMNYRAPGPRSVPVLRCSGERNGACTNKKRVHYELFEQAFLNAAVDIRFASHVADEESARLDAEQAALQVKVSNLTDRKKRIIRTLGDSDDIDIHSVLAEITDEIKPLKARLESVESKLQAQRSLTNNDERRDAFATMQRDLASAETNEEKFAIRMRVANLISEIILNIICFDDGYITVLTKLPSIWKLEHFVECAIDRQNGIHGFEMLPDGAVYRVVQHGTAGMRPEYLTQFRDQWEPRTIQSDGLNGVRI